MPSAQGIGIEVGYIASVFGIHGQLQEGGHEVWRCYHNHRTAGPAEDCAKREKNLRVRERYVDAGRRLTSHR